MFGYVYLLYEHAHFDWSIASLQTLNFHVASIHIISSLRYQSLKFRTTLD